VSAVVAGALLLVACVGFYHARAARTHFDALRRSARRRALLRGSCWGLLALSAWLFALPQGWERGIPAWLGTLSMAGVASLLIAALAPRWHAPTGFAALGVGLAAAALMMTGSA
jgi:hypothetical protein